MALEAFVSTHCEPPPPSSIEDSVEDYIDNSSTAHTRREDPDSGTYDDPPYVFSSPRAHLLHPGGALADLTPRLK